MATKQSQIVINIDDKSVVELNAEIKDLQNNVNKLKVGTEEWIRENEKLGKVKNQLNQVKSAATQLQGVVKTSFQSTGQQIQAVVRTANGLVGAFSAVSRTMGLFGINNEAFEEMTAKATQLMSIMQGLGRVSALFSKTNIAGLKQIGVGFKSLVVTVKAASTAMKAALISTGIGALIVAVGLLIANWDKLLNLFDRRGRKEAKLLQEEMKAAELLTKEREAQYNTAQKELDLRKEDAKYTDSTTDLLQAEADAAKSKLKVLEAEKIANMNLNALLVNGNKAALKKLGIKEEEIEVEKNISDEKQKQLEFEIRTLKDIQAEIAGRQQISGIIDEINRKIKQQENILIKLNAGNDNESKIYGTQRDILLDQIKQLEIIEQKEKERNKLQEERDAVKRERPDQLMDPTKVGTDLPEVKLTQEEKDRLETLRAQLYALDLQEETRKKALKIAIEQIEYERKFLRETQYINDSFISISNQLTEQEILFENQERSLNESLTVLEKLDKEYKDLQDRKRQLVNFDKIGLEMFNKQNLALELQFDAWNDLINKKKEDLRQRIESKKINEGLLQELATELVFYENINNKKIEILENDRETLENERQKKLAEKQTLETLNENSQKQLEYLEGKRKEAQAALEAATNDEERKTALDEVVRLENEISSVNTDIQGNKTEILELNNEIVRTENKIDDITQEIYDTTEDTLKKQEEITAEIERQSRTYVKLQNFVEKYNEEIRTSMDLVAQSTEFVATLFDSKARNIQDRINELSRQFDEMNQKEADRQQRLKKYEDELKDANGDRYEELLTLIDQEKQAKEANFISEEQQRKILEDMDEKRKQQELKAARWRKAQGIIDTIIQTAIAVVKSLPNVFLAAVTGALGAASVATIAAQNIKPYAGGGFTDTDISNGKVAGVVHTNEYIVPAKVLKTDIGGALVGALEKQRVKGYADGGFTPPASTQNYDSIIDYSKLTDALVEAIMELPNPQVGLVNISNGIREVELTKRNSGLAR